MKIILLVLLLSTFASCDKDNQTCWTCDRNLSTEKVKVCNDGETPLTWEDGNGNSFGVYNCKKR